MKKDKKEEICICGHFADRHNGIEKYCYMSGCKCNQYKLKE